MNLQIIVFILSTMMYALTLAIGHLIQKNEMCRREKNREAKPKNREKRAFWLKPVDYFSFGLNLLSMVGVLYGAKQQADSWSLLIICVLMKWTYDAFSPAYLREGGGNKIDTEVRTNNLTPSLAGRP
jgi:hypothetical protein